MNKLDFTVGCGNNRYCLELCVYSFMKYHNQYINNIIIVNNSSTDTLEDFLNNNIYKDITKVINYNNELEMKGLINISKHIELGIDAATTKYVFLSHVDVEYKKDMCGKFFNEVLKEQPDCYLYGFGGGTPENSLRKSDMTIQCRIHEWAMILDKEQYKQSGSSFKHGFDGRYNYDVGNMMYCDALKQKRQIYSLGLLPEQEEYIDHFGASSTSHKLKNEDIAKQRLEKFICK